MTAEHCSIRIGDDAIVAEHDLGNSSDGTRHKICDKVDHPRYDIAIVHLEEPVQMGPRAVHACLPTLKYAGDFLAGKLMTVSGWGNIDYPGWEFPDELHVVNVTGVTLDTCREKYEDPTGEYVTDGDMCAGDITFPLSSNLLSMSILFRLIFWPSVNSVTDAILSIFRGFPFLSLALRFDASSSRVL